MGSDCRDLATGPALPAVEETDLLLHCGGWRRVCAGGGTRDGGIWDGGMQGGGIWDGGMRGGGTPGSCCPVPCRRFGPGALRSRPWVSGTPFGNDR